MQLGGRAAAVQEGVGGAAGRRHTRIASGRYPPQTGDLATAASQPAPGPGRQPGQQGGASLPGGRESRLTRWRPDSAVSEADSARTRLPAVRAAAAALP